MDVSIGIALGFSALVSFLWFPLLLRLAAQKQWVDTPNARRRHKRATPVVGGVGIFAIWFVGTAAYSLLRPDWFSQHSTSLLVVSILVLSLLAIGLADDLKGLSPRWKLAGEFLLAAFVLRFEPETHAACASVIRSAPAFFHAPLWALASIWMVGAANAVNLIDGIDGFAGGVSLLGLLTVLLLHSFSSASHTFMPIALALCLPGILHFLYHNWHPAKLFLGDNGSLTLGFLIAMGGLLPTRPEAALTTAGSLVILLAYPVMDMGLCVFRRFRTGYPIFKADRSHLHHRVQRLGLSVPQTTTLLLCAVCYFQVSALLVHLVHWRLAILVAGSAVLALFSLLYLIQCLESWQRETLLNRAMEQQPPRLASPDALQDYSSVIEVDLRPLLEVGLLEERARAETLLTHLVGELQLLVQPSDCLAVSEQKIKIYLSNSSAPWDNRSMLEARIRNKLLEFQNVFGLQYSINGLPMQAKPLRAA